VNRAQILLMNIVLLVSLACGTAWAQEEPQSSRTVTDYRVAFGVSSPSRIIQTRRQDNGRKVETQIVEAPSDGDYQVIHETEQETIRLDANTVRFMQLMYAPVNGKSKPYQISEEERHTGPGGRESVVRTISTIDPDGHPQVLERIIEETNLTAPDVSETNTTVLRLVAGDLVPVQKFEQTERSKGDSVEVQRKMLAPDGNGNFQIIQVQRSVVTQTDDGQTTEKTTYGNYGEGQMKAFEQTTGSEWESGDTQREMSQTFSVLVPGRTLDNHLHLVQQQSTTTVAAPDGSTIKEEQVQEVNPGAPQDGLRPTALVIEISQPIGNSQTAIHKEVRSRDINNNFPITLETDSRVTTNPQ
jgi:hypothetical protein